MLSRLALFLRQQKERNSVTEHEHERVMKKKKRDGCNGHSHHHRRRRQLSNLRHLLQAIVFRRFCLYGPFRFLFPVLSVVAGGLVLLLAAVSVLSPPPSVAGDRRFISYHYRRSGREFVVGRNLTEFRVPDGGESSGRDLWSSAMSGLYYGCSNGSNEFLTADAKTEPDRYLLIAPSGGLNQQRTGITDAVVVAYMLNATLVVPKLDQNSFWKDSSDFADIFDVDWFISSLSKDVKIIKQLPTVMAGKALNPYSMRVPRKCTPSCYESRVLPVLIRRHAVQLTKFDYRLSNSLDTDLQKLRCKANYHALRFTDSINELGNKLVERMLMKSKHFIALHLRYEADMLAFSRCYYGGGEKEREELGNIRKRWKTLHEGDPDIVRKSGRCPLTPEEVGLMLRALGFGSDVHLYVASGEIYGGEQTLAPLKSLFPNFHTKDTLARKEELAPFTSFSSRMAALDFIVCDESDVFVTNNNGNMAKIIAGRRRFFGHKPTIRPNARKLSKLFLDRNNMTWKAFASKVQTHQIGFMGDPNEIRPDKGVFHENPASCICSDSETTTQNQTLFGLKLEVGKKKNKRNNTDDATDEQLLTEEDPDWDKSEYGENGSEYTGRALTN